MTDKQKALEIIKKIGCKYEFRKADYPRRETEIEVDAPDGYSFDGLSSLVCFSWKDVIERLSNETLKKGDSCATGE